jgi:hypothetical protein
MGQSACRASVIFAKCCEGRTAAMVQDISTGVSFTYILMSLLQYGTSPHPVLMGPHRVR